MSAAWPLFILVLGAIASVAVCLAYAAEHTPETPVLPPQPEGAHGAYVEPEHVKRKREAYTRKRQSQLDKEIDLLARPVREGDKRG